MPAAAGTPSMSFDDFKRSMRTSIRDNGLVDQLKTQVRASLAKELHAKHMMTKSRRPAEAQSLRQKAVESLVDDFLATNGMMYTRSVFYPESSGGLAGGKASQAPARTDILQALGLSCCIPLATGGAANGDEQQPSLLTQLVDALEKHLNKRVATSEVQTDDLSSVPGDFESRLRGVEDDFERQAQVYASRTLCLVPVRIAALPGHCSTGGAGQSNPICSGAYASLPARM